MTGSLPTRSRRPVTALFALSVVALLATAALTVVAVATGDAPERAGRSAAPGDRPSPTTRPPATRAETQQHCLIGSWLTVDELIPTQFYAGVEKLPFATKGRYYEFHPDGTGVERTDNVVMTGTHGGNALRLVANGWREFTWMATDKTLTFVAITKADQIWTAYDHRGLVATQPAPLEPNYNWTTDYRCAGTSVTESRTDGFRSAWARTADYGSYG